MVTGFDRSKVIFAALNSSHSRDSNDMLIDGFQPCEVARRLEHAEHGRLQDAYLAKI